MMSGKNSGSKTPITPKVKEAMSESESDDSVLPEYKKNARKMTKEELEAQAQYNQENIKKFTEELTGGI